MRTSSQRLDSWKQIADYMGRGIRTVQRWHETLHLPVHRINPSGKSPVFAYREELDQWMQQRANHPSAAEQSFAASEARKTTSATASQSARKWKQQLRWHKMLAYELEQNRFTFIHTDLDAAAILIRIAEGAKDKRNRMRNAANADRALDTVEKLLKDSTLPDKESKTIAEKINELRIALKRLHSQTTKAPRRGL